jgi:hypothetical protein
MKARITPLGVLLLLVLATGVVLTFVGSGTTSKIGFVLALAALVFMVADQLPAGLSGGWVVGKGRRPRPPVADPEPQYIERAATPSAEAWRHEQELYRSKGEPDAKP